MRIHLHTAILAVYGVLLFCIAALTAAAGDVTEAEPRWVVIAAGIGCLFVLVNLIATRIFRGPLPILGVRAARIVLIFYSCVTGWLLWRSSGRIETEGDPVYPAVLFGVIFVATLVMLVCELLVDRTGSSLRTEPSPDEPATRRESSPETQTS